jgi:hypothetical protein
VQVGMYGWLYEGGGVYMGAGVCAGECAREWYLYMGAGECVKVVLAAGSVRWCL